MYDWPEAFLNRMAGQLGNELPAFLRALEEPSQRGIRLNPLKPAVASPNGLGCPVPWAENGYYLSAESDAGAVPLHEAGAWYLQEPSAMLPAAVLNAQPGETILDLCAAPGGKSTQLGAALHGQGLLICNEPVPKRALILSRNIERMGITNAVVISAMPDQLAKRWSEGFDAIQVDAPCSGEGMFRRHPETRDEWSPENAAGCAKRQTEILDAAAGMVRMGGRMVYSTCTLNPMENEDVITAFLADHPDFSLEPFHLPGADGSSGMLTCYPHRMQGEGHFVALLRRQGIGVACLPADSSLSKPTKEQLQAYRAFAGKDAPMPTHLLGETLVSMPDCPDVRGLKVLRCGLHLGSVRGKLFMPDHAWAVASAVPSFPHVPLTAEEARCYLKGEALDLPQAPKGWVLAEYEGLCLGWGKCSDGQMKNHYPKGLRR